MHDGPKEDSPANVCIAQDHAGGTDQHIMKIPLSAEHPFPFQLSDFRMWELKLPGGAPGHQHQPRSRMAGRGPRTYVPPPDTLPPSAAPATSIPTHGLWHQAPWTPHLVDWPPAGPYGRFTSSESLNPHKDITWTHRYCKRSQCT